MAVFQSVTETLRRLSFTSGSKTDSGKAHNHLVTMNNPAMMARRDTAYDRAVDLLRDRLFSHDEAERRIIYDAVIKLLDTAIEQSGAIVRIDEQSHGDRLLRYLLLLRDTVRSASTMVRHELVLFDDERELSGFLGQGISSQLQSAEEVFSDSEVSIHRCALDFIDTAEPTVNRYRESAKKLFPKAERERYYKSFAEFRALYSIFGQVKPTPQDDSSEENDSKAGKK